MALIRTTITMAGWAIAFGLLTGPGSAALAAEDFYKGKQITVVVGGDAGDSSDSYARLLARHLPKRIPGSPTVIVQNMPGAGSLTAANYLYNIAPKDGTVVGTFLRNVPLLSLVDRENQQVKLDAVKFTWLGSAATGAGDAYILVVRADVPIQSIEQIRGPDRPTLIMGATAPGTQLYDLPAMLSRTLGLNIKMVAGYNGSQALSLAVMRKEIDGRVSSLSVLRSTLPEWLDQRLVRVLLQMGRTSRHPDFPDVPLSRELAANADDRALIELMDFPQIMATPYVAPPGIPAEAAAILQKAFAEAFRDPDYIAEGKARKMEMSPIDGPALQALLTDMGRKLTSQLVSRYQDIVAKIKAEAK